MGDKKIAHRPHGLRGQWYAADLGHEDVRVQAAAVAKRMKWPCILRKLELPPGPLPISGSGNVSLKGRELDIRGDVVISLPRAKTLKKLLMLSPSSSCSRGSWTTAETADGAHC